MAVKRGVKVAGNEVRIMIRKKNEKRGDENNMSKGGGCVQYR